LLLIARGADTGSISAPGRTALQLSCAAAAGEFEEYEDLLPRSACGEMVPLL
jgi:hypothetical protein